MGKKKIAIVDLSQSETPKLKATGVRSQRLTKTKAPKTEAAPIPVAEPAFTEAPAGKPSEKKAKVKHHLRHSRSKRYLAAKQLIGKGKTYPVNEAIKLLREVSRVKFDPAVELHFNLTGEKLAGELTLPHGTGKKQKIEIASDATLAKLNDGKIDFDILISEPKFMPKLAKFAKVLGPKGLMPNPKTGTISPDPEAVMKKLAGGAMRFKSEPKAPLLHLVVGKLSFKDCELSANITAALAAVQTANIAACFLCSSMSPSIKLQLD